jgi:AraC-like DNA-binding protein
LSPAEYGAFSTLRQGDSAGITAGIDLALAMVEEDHGASVALDVARNLIVFLRRPGGQAQFSVSLSAQASGRKALHDLQVWMAENLNKNLSVDVLARRAAISPRNFSRVFRKETGITPSKFAERLRVESARRQLEQTVKAVKEIAASCGFSSSEIMRRTFLSQLQVTPSAYRLCFSAVVHLGQAARSDIDSWIVASLDRKRLGADFWGEADLEPRRFLQPVPLQGFLIFPVANAEE